MYLILKKPMIFTLLLLLLLLLTLTNGNPVQEQELDDHESSIKTETEDETLKDSEPATEDIQKVEKQIDPLEPYNLEDIAEIRKLETKSILSAPHRTNNAIMSKCESGEVYIEGNCLKFVGTFKLEGDHLVKKFTEMLNRRKSHRKKEHKRRRQQQQQHRYKLQQLNRQRILLDKGLLLY